MVGNPQIRKMAPTTGQASSFLERKKVFNKLNSFPFLLFFLPPSPGPTWAVWSLPSSPVLLFFLRPSPWQGAVPRYRDAVHRHRVVVHRQGRFSPIHFHNLASIFWEWPGADSRCFLLQTTFSSSSCSVFLFFLLYLFRILSSAFLSSVLQSLKIYLL